MSTEKMFSVQDPETGQVMVATADQLTSVDRFIPVGELDTTVSPLGALETDLATFILNNLHGEYNNGFKTYETFGELGRRRRKKKRRAGIFRKIARALKPPKALRSVISKVISPIAKVASKFVPIPGLSLTTEAIFNKRGRKDRGGKSGGWLKKLFSKRTVVDTGSKARKGILKNIFKRAHPGDRAQMRREFKKQMKSFKRQSRKQKLRDRLLKRFERISGKKLTTKTDIKKIKVLVPIIETEPDILSDLSYVGESPRKRLHRKLKKVNKSIALADARIEQYEEVVIPSIKNFKRRTGIKMIKNQLMTMLNLAKILIGNIEKQIFKKDGLVEKKEVSTLSDLGDGKPVLMTLDSSVVSELIADADETVRSIVKVLNLIESGIKMQEDSGESETEPAKSEAFDIKKLLPIAAIAGGILLLKKVI